MSNETSSQQRPPLLVAAVVGSFALAVGLVVRLSGVLGGVEAGLAERYLLAGFPVAQGATQPWWSLLLLVTLVYGMAMLLLDIPGTARRVLVAATSLVLVLSASPVMALWGVFWSPVVAAVSGGWSAFCAILWARHHPMRCEVVEPTVRENVISMAEERRKRKQG